MARPNGVFKMEVPHYGECTFRRIGVHFVSTGRRGVRWTIYSQFGERITSVDVPLRTSQAKVYEKCIEAIKAKEISDEINAHDEAYLRGLDRYHLR